VLFVAALQAEPVWPIEVPADRVAIVDAYEELYLAGQPRERLVSAFEYARFFLAFVQERLAERGLPPDLAFLPVIES